MKRYAELRLAEPIAGANEGRQSRLTAAPGGWAHTPTTWTWDDPACCEARVRIRPAAGVWDKGPLSDVELAGLRKVIHLWQHGGARWAERYASDAARVLEPLAAALDHLQTQGASASSARDARLAIVRHVVRTERSYWEWRPTDWLDSLQIGPDDTRGVSGRIEVVGTAYLLTGQRVWAGIPMFNRRWLAGRVLGEQAFSALAERLHAYLKGSGYKYELRAVAAGVEAVLGEALLLRGSVRPDDLSTEILAAVRADETIPATARWNAARISVALHAWGHVKNALAFQEGQAERRQRWTEALEKGIATEWAALVRRWDETSTLEPKSRKSVRTYLLQAGRWLAQEYPDVTHPAQWTTEMAAEYVASAVRAKVGQYAVRQNGFAEGKVGTAQSPKTVASRITAMRRFFMDVQKWKWEKLEHLDPLNDFEIPKAVQRKIGPNPRDIKQSVWMKLVWASLNLTEDDLNWAEEVPEDRLPTASPGGPRRPRRERIEASDDRQVRAGHALVRSSTTYPLVMIRALAVLWTHAGLRSDELVRLREGCIREVSGETDPALQSVLHGEIKDLICLLDVPVNKTSPAYTKPVGRVVQEAVAAWVAVRPRQGQQEDPKTGELCHFLFSTRNRQLDKHFVNRVLIPILCQKAGVPEEDVPGKRITSHRGRASAATWYLNTKEGMSLEELMRWLGHRHLSSTQHYARPSPVKQIESFARAHANSYMVEVLVDKGAVQSGAAAQGQPWQYFALGNEDFCSNPFYSKCAHRLACAQCDFYVPSDRQLASILSARGHLERMYAEMPLDEEERLAVQGGAVAMTRLAERLAQTPTPSGQTPIQLRKAKVRALPILSVPP